MLSYVYLYKRKAKRFYILRRVGGNMTTKAEIGVIRPQAKGCQQPPVLEEERKRLKVRIQAPKSLYDIKVPVWG